MKFFAKVLASGFGAGFSPVAPGTAGSALAVVIIFFCAPWWSTVPALALTAVTFLIGTACCSVAEKDWGHDSGRMVIDEIAGMFLAMAFFPVEPGTLAAVFFLFRLFDIIKPPPASNAENLPSGWGVMTDDLIAGAYAAVVVAGLRLLI
ncbi:MAG: phosphatidylglycerophosphatase A [Gemmatimonadota bacterium]|nr:phosphatidylglycerophosphatase A [Gemmatimonadota bacterium]